MFDYYELMTEYEEEMSKYYREIPPISFSQLIIRKVGIERYNHRMMLHNYQIKVIDECKNRIELNKNEPGRFPKGAGISVPMGGGKTLISLILGLEISGDLPILIICPKSLLPSWRNEIIKFFGNLDQVLLYHGDLVKTNLDTLLPLPNTKFVITTPQMLYKYYKMFNLENQLVTEVLNENNVMVKHYHYIEDIDPQINFLYSTHWGAVFFDEMHAFSKITTVTNRSALPLISNSYWPLSGTLFAEPKPERFLYYYRFIHDPIAPVSVPAAATYYFSAKSKFPGTEVSIVKCESLPFKIVKHTQQIRCTFKKEEEIIFLEMGKLIKQIKDELEYNKNLSKQTRDAEYKRNLVAKIKTLNGTIISFFGTLRLVLISPLAGISSITANLLNDKVRDRDVDALVVNFFNKLNTVPGLKNWMEDLNNERSSRIVTAINLSFLHDKVVLFTSFRVTAQLIIGYLVEIQNNLRNKSRYQALSQEEINILNKEIFTIESKDNINKRGDILFRCQKSNNFIFVLTYSIGAVGLNLAFANTVITLDYSWNASETKQAIARVARQGQREEVNIYQLISNTKVEEIILQKQDDKIKMEKELEKQGTSKRVTKANVGDSAKMVDVEDTNMFTMMDQIYDINQTVIYAEKDDVVTEQEDDQFVE